MPVNLVAHSQRGAEAESQAQGETEETGLRTWEGMIEAAHGPLRPEAHVPGRIEGASVFGAIFRA